MPLPDYPEFAPVSLEFRADLYPALNVVKDGISELTFANIYLFRSVYDYRVSRLPCGSPVIEGERYGKRFFSLPCCLPEAGLFDELMSGNDYFKNLSESQAQVHRIDLETRGYSVVEDRDNFDYLYDRIALAELSGRAYHKKRNLVNAFLNSYTYEQKPLRRDNAADALKVLEEWRSAKGSDGDYNASKEAVELFDLLEMRGCVYYVDGSPAGWCLGESVARGRMFAIHFEKACDRYKGIYQFINQAFAQALPAHFKTINREQDLGDQGLRQAKMTYRPSGFVKKYRVVRSPGPGDVP